MIDAFARRKILLRIPIDAHEPWAPAPLWATAGVGWLIAIVVGVIVWRAAGPGALVATSVVGVSARPAVARLHRVRDRQRAAADLASALEAVARSLRTGASLPQAIAEAGATVPGPVGRGLAAVAARAAAGEGLDDALAWWSQTTSVPGVRLAAAALGLGFEAGGPQARAVDAVAATVRQRLAAAEQARALAAQARLSGVVIGLAPLAFCALAAATDGRTATFLFRSGPGLVALACGLGLDLVGGWWMHRITESVAP